MLKRKLMLPLLALIMTLVMLPASAVQLPPELMALLGGSMEPAEMALVEDNFIVYDGMLGKSAYYIAAVENKSDAVATVNAGTLQLFDAAGNEVGSQNLYGSTPTYVQPGGITYMTNEYFTVDAEVLEQVASWKLTVEGGIVTDTTYEPAPLDITVEMSEGTEFSFMTGSQDIKQIKFVSTITNGSGEAVFDPMTLLVLRDASGKVVAAETQAGLSVGIPAGGSMYLQSAMPTGMPDALDAKGLTVATVEGIAYYIPDRAD